MKPGACAMCVCKGVWELAEGLQVAIPRTKFFISIAVSKIVHLQVPNPFPIPTFRDRTEANLKNCRLADDDRKYMVRTLSTMLCAYKRSPSRNDCWIVANSLIRKFGFLKESVSFCIFTLLVGIICRKCTHVFSILGNSSSI